MLSTLLLPERPVSRPAFPARRLAAWIALSCALHAALLLGETGQEPMRSAQGMAAPAVPAVLRATLAEPAPAKGEIHAAATLPAPAATAVPDVRPHSNAVPPSLQRKGQNRRTREAPAAQNGAGPSNLLGVFRVRYGTEATEVAALYVAARDRRKTTACGDEDAAALWARTYEVLGSGKEQAERTFLVTVAGDAATGVMAMVWQHLGPETNAETEPRPVPAVQDPEVNADISAYLDGRPTRWIADAPRPRGAC